MRKQRHTKVVIALTGEMASGKSLLVEEILLPALLAAGCRVKTLSCMDAPGFPPREALHVLIPVNSAERLREHYKSFYEFKETGKPLPRATARNLERAF